MKKLIKKLLLAQLILGIILSLVLDIINQNEVKAVTQYSKLGISEFPDSYQNYLRQLSELYPNWNFTAFYTGISWNEFMRNESSLGGDIYPHARNTVISSADMTWLDSCNITKSGYSCASPEIIAYYSDPRNFLTETGIFQFLEMSYNSSVHNKEGVESIIKGTFMDTEIDISKGDIQTNIKAKINEEIIMATPGTTNDEIASAVGITNYIVVDNDNNTVANSDNSITGYILKNNDNNKVYRIAVLGDVNGDGQIKATDYARIKNYIMGTGALTDIQKIAADVNEDGEVKATDYARIKNYIMNSTPIAVKTEGQASSDKMSYSDIIIKAAEESGISPYSIAIKIIQEVGRQGSNSVHGTYPGYEGYYNFYNIGAYDSGNAIENGLRYAKEKGWNDQYKSIVEGAKEISNKYIGVGQNTAYFYKFDVVDDSKTGLYWHQYMTNIEDPSSQAKNLYNTYATNGIINISLNFVIPVFDDMPDQCKKPSKIDQNAATSYYVNGTGVKIRSSATTNSEAIGTLSKNEVVTVENLSVSTADGYTWAKIIRANGTVGYVANMYLVKC